MPKPLNTPDATKGGDNMARAKKTAGRKPAGSRKPAAVRKPATAKAKVTVQTLADRLNMTPKALRRRIRTILGDGKAVVGRGRRYGWPSFSHPEVKKILSEVGGKGE